MIHYLDEFVPYKVYISNNQKQHLLGLPFTTAVSKKQFLTIDLLPISNVACWCQQEDTFLKKIASNTIQNSYMKWM